MTNYNSMSKTEYVITTLLMIPISVIWFNTLFFKSIASLTRSESQTVLYSMLALSLIIGICITWKKRRNAVNLYVNFCLPFEAYMLIAYKDLVPHSLWIALILSVVCTVPYIILIMSQKISEHSNRIKMQAKRFLYALKGCRTIVTACFALALVQLFASIAISGSLISADVTPEIPSDNPDWTIEKQIETLLKFDEERWETLSNEEQVSCLQTVANIEAARLGLPHELNLRVGAVDEDVSAHYDDGSHLITVGIDTFSNAAPLSLIRTVCHEAFHAYEYRLCEAYEQIDAELRYLEPFKDAALYKYEFANYYDAEDFDRYYVQRCETDAREYADEAADIYSRYIMAHMYSSQ